MEPADIKLKYRRKRTSQLSDENFRVLFDNMTEGFSLNEIVYDKAGKPCDYRILETNPSFERLTGLKRKAAIGKLATEVFPGLETYWIQAFAQVVLTGQPAQFENYTATLGRYYRVYAYRPAPGQFAVIFMDITERKQAEDRLAYLASFPERNPNPIVEVDLEGKVHYANPTASRLFPDLIEQGPAHSWLTDLDGIIRQFHLDQAEILTRDISMGDRVYQQTLDYITSEHLIRIYGLEITKRKKAEAALQDSEQMLSRAQEIAHLGSWELDLVKNHLTWSDEVYRIFGYQPQEFAATYEAFLDAVHPDDRAAVDAAYNGSIRDCRDSYDIEHRLVKRSTGEVRLVHEKCLHFRDETGKVIRSEGMVHDITEQKQAEEALRLSEEKYRTMVETAAEGIALVKPDGTFFYINQQMADMLGYPMNEIIGKTGTDFMYDNQQSLVQQLRNELHKGDVLHGEFHFRRKDGSELWSRYNASPIFNENGEHVSNLAMHTDITKHKRAEQALLQAYDELELRVQERTQELNSANGQLRAEIIERQKSQTNLESSLQELQVIEEELRNNNEMLLDAQKVLDAERKRFRDLFEFAPDAYLVTDKNGLILEANQFATRMLEISHRNLIRKPLLVFVSQGDHIAYKHLIATTNRQQAIQNQELRLLPRHGQEITAAVKVTFAPDPEKNDTLRWTIRDITERKRAEDIIRQNLLRNSVLTELTQSLAGASLDEKVILDIVAKTSARLIGDSCVITLVSEDGQWLDPVTWHHNKPEAQELMSSLYASGHHSSSEGPSGQVYQTSRPLLIPSMAAPGTTGLVSEAYLKYLEQVGITSLLVVPLLIGNRCIGTMGLTRDYAGQLFTVEDQSLVEILAYRVAQSIHNARMYQELQNSLRQELETHNQLVQAEKFAAVGRLLASITHEINNPLQTIKNCLYLSQLDTIQGTPINDALTIAVAETNRLSNLVAQLREIYRPPSQGQSHPVDLLALLGETKTLLQGYLQDNRITWQLTLPDARRFTQCKVEGVPEQLKQVFLNICLNAIDAMELAGGSLLIDFILPPGDNQVGISFRDTGPGLSPEVKAKLFEPFTTTKEKGLGLGLVICYDIMQKHHGRIEVESEAGEGAAFIVWLPANRETV